MTPLGTLLAVTVALGGAAAIWLTWWLGVWGSVATLRARVRVLEATRETAQAELVARVAAQDLRIDSLQRARQSEAGQRGAEKQRQRKELEERRAAEGQVAWQEELKNLPALRGKRPLAVAGGPSNDADAPDVVDDATA